jgi:hypothetical protein
MILGHLPRSPLPPRPEQRLKLIERTQGVTHTLLRGRLARSSTLIAQHVRTHFRNGLTSPPSIGGLHRKRRSGAPDCRKADISKSCNRLARAQQRQKLEQTSTSMDDHALAIRRSGQDRTGRSCPGARRSSLEPARIARTAAQKCALRAKIPSSPREGRAPRPCGRAAITHI